MQAVGSTQPRGGLAYKWQAAPIVALGLFLSVLDSTIVSVALPAMRQTFSTDFNTITWVVTAYFLAQAAVIPITGYLTDRAGTKIVFLLAMVLFVLGSVACAVAPTEGALLVARALQGLGGGMLWPTSFAIAYRAFPREEWGRATSIIGVPVLLAPVLGPVIGGYLTEVFSWRAIFAINLPLGLLTLLVGAAVLRAGREDEEEESAQTTRGHFDVAGLVLAMVGFTVLVYGLTRAGTNGWGDTAADGALIVGALAVTALLAVELRAANPVLDVRLFLSPTFARASIVLWVVVAVFYGSLFLIPFFFEKVEGLTPLTAGQIMIAQGLAAAAGIALSGELYSKFGPRTIVSVGAVALALSMIGFAHLDVASTGLSVQGWLVLRGFGLGLTTQPLQNLALATVSHRSLARASSLINVTRQVAIAAGVAALTSLVTQRVGTHAATVSASLHTAAPDNAARACLAAGTAGVRGCVERHAIVLSLNDGFTVALAVCAVLVLLALIVGTDPTRQAHGSHGVTPLAVAFPHLSPAELEEAKRRAQSVSFAAGQAIVRQGEAADRLYIVTKGEATVLQEGAGGRTVQKGTLRAGEIFGEIGVLGKQARTATVVAATPVELLAFDHRAIGSIMTGSPRTADDLRGLMAARLAMLP